MHKLPALTYEQLTAMKDQQIDDFNSKQIFVRDAMPDEWLGYSEELADAAEVLWNGAAESMKINITGDLANSGGLLTKTFPHPLSYLLLIAFALENVLKATAIAANPALINTGALDKKLITHDWWNSPMVSTGWCCPMRKQNCCPPATEAIPYWSRYPVPLTHKKVQVAGAATPKLRDTFLKLHYRLCEAVHKQIKDGWDSGAGPQIGKCRSLRYGDTWDPNEPFPWAKKD